MKVYLPSHYSSKVTGIRNIYTYIGGREQIFYNCAGGSVVSIDLRRAMLRHAGRAQELARLKNAHWTLAEIDIVNPCNTTRCDVPGTTFFADGELTTKLFNLTRIAFGVEGEPLLVAESSNLPAIVSAMNYIYRADRHIGKIEIAEPFKKKLHKAYRDSGFECNIRLEDLARVLDPESLVASGAVCKVPCMTDEEIDARLEKLIAESRARR